MTTLRQAAQQALEALESFLDFSNGGSYPKYSRHKHPRWVKTENAITTLREALAQPEQEPVAWLKEDWTGGHLNYESVYEGAFAAFPVYKHPLAAQRPWVGLTDEDMKDPKTHILNFIYGARWAEAKLKERNT